MKEKSVATSHEKVHEPQIYNGVSTEDVPSAAWGWSEMGRTTILITGWVSVFILLAFHFGNHEGHVETIWLFAIAALIAIGLLLFGFQPKLPNVRTITGHNKPVDHLEPDWAYNQKTLSGHYATLTDGQLRALNIEPSRVSHLRVTPGTSTASKEIS